jgi:hypothetical protein
MARSVKQTIRLSETEQAQLLRAAKDRGYLNPTALIRAAIQDELAGRETEGISAEQRIAATLERLSRDIFRVHRGQQALFAVLDTLVKVFLTCVPEPPRDAMNQAVARARDRYDRFVKSAGQAMVGAQGSMQDLVNRAE